MVGRTSRNLRSAVWLFNQQLAVSLVVISLLLIQSPLIRAARAADVPGTIPASLVDVGEFGENIYDAARAKDWSAAATKLDAIKKAAAKLPGDFGQPTAEQKKKLDQLAIEFANLTEGIAAKNRHMVEVSANQVTLIAVELTIPYNPRLPADVTRLDFLGRELEIWSESNDMDKLQNAAKQIQLTWSRVRPVVETHGGIVTAKTFDKLVTQLMDAKSSKEFSAVAKPILDEVDNLEKVFAK